MVRVEEGLTCTDNPKHAGITVCLPKGISVASSVRFDRYR